MNCDRFARWLDDGMPSREAASMLTHARDCVRCARALAAAQALERVLVADAPAAPALSADFTATVMSRLDLSRPAAAATPRRAPSWLPLALDPTLLASVATAVLLVVEHAAVESALRLGAARAQALGAWIGPAGASITAQFARLAIVTQLRQAPGGDWALIALALTLVVPASWWLYQVSQGLFAQKLRLR
jgi:hypothetical protein